MSRTDRLFQIMQILRDGQLHMARDIARRCCVSTRTIYRDMDTLMASGVPVKGTRGAGYHMENVISLPPLTLSPQELEVLNLGLAIVSQAGDASLVDAAQTLTNKIDDALPERSLADADAWKFATYPFANAVQGFGHMPTLRAAIKAKQKLRLSYHSKGDRVTTRTIRPLHLEHVGRIWTLTAWCEARSDFREFRVDLIQSATALPELFTDEPGKTFDDFRR